MLHSAESKFSTLQSRLTPRIRKYFRVFIRGLGEVDLWKKTRGRKSRETVSLRPPTFISIQLWKTAKSERSGNDDGHLAGTAQHEDSSTIITHAFIDQGLPKHGTKIADIESSSAGELDPVVSCFVTDPVPEVWASGTGTLQKNPYFLLIFFSLQFKNRNIFCSHRGLFLKLVFWTIFLLWGHDASIKSDPDLWWKLWNTMFSAKNTFNTAGYLSVWWISLLYTYR
jgi:hypothetical protein